jgi:hypothetical protein
MPNQLFYAVTVVTIRNNTHLRTTGCRECKPSQPLTAMLNITFAWKSQICHSTTSHWTVVRLVLASRLLLLAVAMNSDDARHEPARYHGSDVGRDYRVASSQPTSIRQVCKTSLD